MNFTDSPYGVKIIRNLGYIISNGSSSSIGNKASRCTYGFTCIDIENWIIMWQRLIFILRK